MLLQFHKGHDQGLKKRNSKEEFKIPWLLIPCPRVSLALVHKKKKLKVKYSVSLHNFLLILSMDKRTEEILVLNKYEPVIYVLYIEQIYQYM